eukprot:757896-Hanusia_phi.AAC.4
MRRQIALESGSDIDADDCDQNHANYPLDLIGHDRHQQTSIHRVDLRAAVTLHRMRSPSIPW